MTTASPLSHSMARPRLGPAAGGLIGGLVVGLIVGGAVGYLIGSGAKPGASWTDASAAWARLPEQTAMGALPQTFSIWSAPLEVIHPFCWS